ncbi:MAG: helix-turn-helix transcriptional regulator [Clostridiales bacterium]|nr:helix-turn-helix transcriptional regulator [Candidatus Equinaster intestinalis]
MNEKYIADRITELRLKKNVSEYRMSLDLGHSNSYIRSITSGKALPSMTEFLYICDYLGITPKEFFDEDLKNTEQVKRLYDLSKKMSQDDLTALISMAERLTNK